MSKVDEIIDGVREGRYRMINSKVDPMQRLRISPELPKGEWIPLKKYHPNTIRAAQRRMKYRFDVATMTGIYSVEEASVPGKSSEDASVKLLRDVFNGVF